MARCMVMLLALAAAARGGQAYTCTDDDGCEQLGKCVAGACVCSAGWTGPSCGQLNLAPSPGLTGGAMVWPKLSSNAAQQASAWGFTARQDPADGLWYAVATVACNGSGVVADGGGESYMALLRSQGDALGPWQLLAPMTAQTSFGPHLAAVPASAGGGFLLTIRVNAMPAPGSVPACAGNGSGTDPVPAAWMADPLVPSSDLAPGDPEAGQNMFTAYAPRMTGPWRATRFTIGGIGNTHASNQHIFPLAAPTPAGDAWAAVYRYNPGGPSQNALALAPSWRGPWRCVANLTAGVPKANNEDPFGWQQQGSTATGASDDAVHMVWHEKQLSWHAWYSLSEGLWRTTPTGMPAWSTNVTLASTGGLLQLQRRERPELLFDPSTGAPTLLLNGAVGPDGTAFSFAQAVASGGGRE